MLLAMQVGMPSRTAFGVARRRALHQLYDGAPRVLADPFAVRILGAETATDLEGRAGRPETPLDMAMRAQMVVRARYAEDQLARAYAAGVLQYCVLGAGFDTFGYRNPLPGLRVFEVDHPATQGWKLQRLADAGMDAPKSVVYVPVDFETQSLAEQLSAGGFRQDEPAFFTWLGVIPYLGEAAFRGTVAYLAARPAGSGFAADYGLAREALPEAERVYHDLLCERVARAGEPFQLFFTPETMRLELDAFRRVEDLGSAELNARYFAGRDDGLCCRGDGGRVLSAWV